MLESGVNETDLVERQTSRRDSIAALLLGRLPVTLESNVEDQARLRLRRTHGGQDACSGALRRVPSGSSALLVGAVHLRRSRDVAVRRWPDVDRGRWLERGVGAT